MRNKIIGWVLVLFVGAGVGAGLTVSDISDEYGVCILEHESAYSWSYCKYGKNDAGYTFEKLGWRGEWVQLTDEQVAQIPEAKQKYWKQQAPEAAAIGAVYGVLVVFGLLALYVAFLLLTGIGRKARFYGEVKHAELLARKAAAEATLKRENPDAQQHDVTIKGSVKIE